MSDADMMEALALGGRPISREELDSYFLKEEEEGYALCPRNVLEALLDKRVMPSARAMSSKRSLTA